MLQAVGHCGEMWSSVNWAYLAGFTDADGFVVAQRGKAYIAAARIGWTQMRSARWQLEEIQAFLNSEDVFSYLGDELDKRHGRWSSRLRVSQEASSRIVLTNLIPHLVLKRAIAIEVLRQLDERRAARVRQGRRYRVFDDRAQLAERLLSESVAQTQLLIVAERADSYE